MIASLTIVRYKNSGIPLALIAQALFRIPLSFQKGCSFWKLMGSGRNGTFDLRPDWQQWAIFAVWDDKESLDNFLCKSFITRWISSFSIESWTVVLEPVASHGFWDGKELFKGSLSENTEIGPIAVLTRATIRMSQLRAFWNNVPHVAQHMAGAKGLITSFGIGEAPVYRQATFSIWTDVESMKEFAYRSREHADVIRSTRKENWYAEELFARFRILSSEGTINGTNPLANFNEIDSRTTASGL